MVVAKPLNHLKDIAPVKNKNLFFKKSSKFNTSATPGLNFEHESI